MNKSLDNGQMRKVISDTDMYNAVGKPNNGLESLWGREAGCFFK